MRASFGGRRMVNRFGKSMVRFDYQLLRPTVDLSLVNSRDISDLSICEVENGERYTSGICL